MTRPIQMDDGLQIEYRRLIAANRFCIHDPSQSEVLTCVAVDDLVRGVAAQLSADGVGLGEAVIFLGGQSLSAFVHFWATVLLGGIFVPVDPSWPLTRVDAICSRLRPRLLIAEAEIAAACSAHLPGLTLRCVEELPRGGAALPAVCRENGAAAAYLLTSGSSGDPKVVVLSRAALLRSARLAVATFGWGEDELLLNLPDPHTMSGLRNAFLAAPMAGMAWICLPLSLRQNLFLLLDAIRTRQPTRIVAAPSLLRQINLLGERLGRDDFPGLKAVYCTGADLHRAEVERFHARYGIPVINYYGLTETVGLCLSQDFADWHPADASLGRPVGCDIRIVSGELQVRSPLPMSGYLDDAEETARMFDGSWLRTGDLAHCDEQGRVHLDGRCSAFINTLSTEKIYPGEIEAALERLPGVAEAAVCGLADAAGGERIAALIVASSATVHALCAGDLAQGIHAALGPGRVPSAFKFVHCLPRSSNGKILRHKLPDFFLRA